MGVLNSIFHQVLDWIVLQAYKAVLLMISNFLQSQR